MSWFPKTTGSLGDWKDDDGRGDAIEANQSQNRGKVEHETGVTPGIETVMEEMEHKNVGNGGSVSIKWRTKQSLKWWALTITRSIIIEPQIVYEVLLMGLVRERIKGTKTGSRKWMMILDIQIREDGLSKRRWLKVSMWLMFYESAEQRSL